MINQAFRILVVNFGSTSTKISLFENEVEKHRVNMEHPRSEIDRYKTIPEQLPMRRYAVESFLREAKIDIKGLSAIAARAGILPPLEAGAYKVNSLMVERLLSAPLAEHAANLCAVIAHEMAAPSGIPVYIYDSSVIDQMDDVARISGIPEIARTSKAHLENMRAAAFETARMMNRPYEDLNLIVAHMGGGTSLSIHRKGRVVDIISDDEGPFAPERAGGVPCIDLIKLCFSGKYDEQATLKFIRGKGGLLAYLGTTDALEIEARIRNNDREAEIIYYAMAYQVAKGIGQLATVVNGQVDRIILTGGLSRSRMLTGWLEEKVGFLAPLEIIPGEREMEHLALGTLRVLQGIETAREYDSATDRSR